MWQRTANPIAWNVTTNSTPKYVIPVRIRLQPMVKESSMMGRSGMQQKIASTAPNATVIYLVNSSSKRRIQFSVPWTVLRATRLNMNSN